MYTFSDRIKAYFRKLPITATLLSINLLMVIVVMLTGGFTIPNLTRLGGMNPILVSQGHEYHRLFMAMFLHGSIIHFLANSYFLYFMGGFVERLLGRNRYIIIYLLSGIGSSLLVWWLGDDFAITIGASGALFGILGAALLLTYMKPQWFTPLGIKNIRTITVINLVFTFLIPNISVYGHLGGLITGILLIYLLTPNRPSMNQFFKKKDDEQTQTVIIDHDDITDDDIFYS